MINKDYLLRLAEQFGRELAVLLHLRQSSKYDEALIYIDDLLLKTVGLTSRFINSLAEDVLVKMLSPLGPLNVDASLWIATMLKAEGEIYEEQGNTKESYYRYLKSLYLFLAVLHQEPADSDSHFYIEAQELLKKLTDYELPNYVKQQLLPYYEHVGQYARTEDTLFELLEASPHDSKLLAQGRAFYTRLLAKSAADLQAGNFSHEEAEEGLKQLQ